MNIQLLQITDEVFWQYGKIITSDKYTSRDLIQRKLTRNRILAVPMGKTRDGKGVIYSYGSLKFMVRDEVVVWLEGNHPTLPMWYKDNEKYKELNMKLGINEIEVAESEATIEANRVIRRKTKRLKNGRSQLFYLRSRVLMTIGDNDDSKWLIDHIDTIYNVLKNDDEEDTIWNK